MKTRKTLKALSMLLALCTVFSMFGLLALAVEGDGADTGTVFSEAWDGTTADTAWYENADAEATSFEIDTAAELAGLAKLVNDKTDNFNGKTVYITANLDLGGKEWTPIGNTNAIPFYGMLEGKLGGVEGAAVTIKGMSIKAPASANMGLIGTQSAGGAKNMIMIESEIVTDKNTAGSFVGYAKTSALVYENLKSDTPITSSAGQYIGGIVAYVNVGGATITNCVYTGNIVATGASAADIGGITGKFNSDGTIENCEVTGTITASGATSERIGGITGDTQFTGTKIKNCKVSATLTSAGKQYLAGIIGTIRATSTLIEGCEFTGVLNANGTSMIMIGGIAGNINGPGSVIKDCVVLGSINLGANGDGNGGQAGGILGKYTSDAKLENCYVGANITVSGAQRRIGGIVGYVARGKAGDHIIRNCQFDGELFSNNTQVGSIAGRVDCTAINAPFILENILVTGVAEDARTIDRMFSMVGLLAGTSNSAVVNAKNVYSAYESNIIGGGDAGTATATITVNGTAKTVTSAAATDFRDAAGSATTVAYASSIGDAAKTGYAGLDFTSVWTARDGEYPVLTVAKDVDTGIYGAADLTWFTPKTNTNYVINTYEQLLGLSRISQIHTFSGYTVKVGANIKGYTKDVVYKEIGDTKANWIGIGRNDNSFMGTFDGQGNEISGLVIREGDANARAAMFNRLAGTGCIKDLILTNCYFAGVGEAGGLIGRITGTPTVENVYVSAKANSTGQKSPVGGIAGSIGGTGASLSDVVFDGEVEGYKYVGGITGEINGSLATLTDCVAYGHIRTTATQAGGLVGRISSGNNETTDAYSFTRCISYAEVDGQLENGGTQYDAGGFVGLFYAEFVGTLEFVDCYLLEGQKEIANDENTKYSEYSGIRNKTAAEITAALTAEGHWTKADIGETSVPAGVYTLLSGRKTIGAGDLGYQENYVAGEADYDVRFTVLLDSLGYNQVNVDLTDKNNAEKGIFSMPTYNAYTSIYEKGNLVTPESKGGNYWALITLTDVTAGEAHNWSYSAYTTTLGVKSAAVSGDITLSYGVAG